MRIPKHVLNLLLYYTFFLNNTLFYNTLLLAQFCTKTCKFYRRQRSPDPTNQLVI